MLSIRKATVQDAPAWIELLRAILGNDYPDRQIYDPSWAANQLGESEAETWVAEADGVLHCSLSFLAGSVESGNPVANVGRHLNQLESYENGAAAALLQGAVDIASRRKLLLVSRVIASETEQELLYEQAGFTCVGFQPYKHSHRQRQNALFYYRLGGLDLANRLPISESLPQVSSLARLVLGNLGLPAPLIARDGVTGYPISGDIQFAEGTRDDFEVWKLQATNANSGQEISGAYNLGIGYLRTLGSEAPAALFAVWQGRVTAGVLYHFDAIDRSVRLIDSFMLDDGSLGAVLNQTVKKAQELAAIYLELDAVVTAPRLLKTAEQIGFIPVAYLPGVYWRNGQYTDIIKMVKLNLVYSIENVVLSSQAKSVAQVIDQSFQDQKMGVAIINLLAGLPIFDGLGDGDLRKIARLFTQKLYRAGEKIFAKASSGNEAYVVMRGQVDIRIENGSTLAELGNGQIFGELAFLDGSPRTADAVAVQPSILLVIQRTAFNTLVQREPHLGMIVMRNIALELSNRLRKTNRVVAK